MVDLLIPPPASLISPAILRELHLPLFGATPSASVSLLSRSSSRALNISSSVSTAKLAVSKSLDCSVPEPGRGAWSVVNGA